MMAQDMIRRVLIGALVAATVVLTSAQAQRKAKYKSPFQNPEGEDVQKTSRRLEQHQGKALAQSPFTPPRDVIGKEQTTKRAETTPATTMGVVVDMKVAHAIEEKQVPNAGSPFSPPPKSEWREKSKPSRPLSGGNRKQAQVTSGKPSPWLDSVEERQKENVDSIPPLANINVSDTVKDTSPPNRKRFKGRPKTALVQEKGQRDIHETEPGVTPWTRYTDKPRVKEEPSASGKANARCGRQRYNPRNQICCQGRVARRHGLSPACCSQESYDTVFNKCCDGVISARTNDQSDC